MVVDSNLSDVLAASIGAIVKLQWIRLGKRDSKAMTAKLGIDIVVRKLVWPTLMCSTTRTV